ncbi:MAG: Gfo/Idh/MocA family oxidoreductase [Rhodobacterales bacterium]|nr:Gfo/Idh/MocA family oxidoreductase [Rhodobacterales bacterium]
MTDTPLRIAVVGCGSMGRRRIRHAIELGGADVMGWDIRADRRAEVEGLFPMATADSEAGMWGWGPDALFISVPPAEHEHYIFGAIERGIPFMVEQPITHRLDNLGAIRAGVAGARAGAGLVCHVSSNQRFSPRVHALEKALTETDVGKPLTGLVEIGEWLPDWHPYEPYQDYYPSWKRMGGGLDAICDLDWLRHLFGEVGRAVSLTSRKSDLEIDTDDVVQLILDFVDGPQIMVHCDMLQRPFRRQSRIVCMNGTIVHEHPNQSLQVYVVDRDETVEIPFQVDLARYPHMQGKPQHTFAEPMYEADSAVFLRRLVAGDTSLDSLDTGLANLRLVLPLIFGDGS